MKISFPCLIGIMLSVLFIVSLSCAPAVERVYLLSDKLPPKPENHPIKLFLENKPECDFEEIGMITSRKRNIFVSMEEVTESLREEARKMGGDAVIKVQLGNKTMGAYFSKSNVIIDNDPVLSGIVIRWLEKDCNY